jgi:hypothetical protein
LITRLGKLGASEIKRPDTLADDEIGHDAKSDPQAARRAPQS